MLYVYENLSQMLKNGYRGFVGSKEYEDILYFWWVDIGFWGNLFIYEISRTK